MEIGMIWALFVVIAVAAALNRCTWEAQFSLHPLGSIALVSALSLFGCGEKHETIEQYAKNPVGCVSRPAQWYEEQASTKAGQDNLRLQIQSYQLRAEYHGRQVDFSSLSAAEKSEQVNKTLQCLREVKWASETLLKAGLPIK